MSEKRRSERMLLRNDDKSKNVSPVGDSWSVEPRWREENNQTPSMHHLTSTASSPHKLTRSHFKSASSVQPQHQRPSSHHSPPHDENLQNHSSKPTDASHYNENQFEELFKEDADEMGAKRERRRRTATKGQGMLRELTSLMDDVRPPTSVNVIDSVSNGQRSLRHKRINFRHFYSEPEDEFDYQVRSRNPSPPPPRISHHSYETRSHRPQHPATHENTRSTMDSQNLRSRDKSLVDSAEDKLSDFVNNSKQNETIPESDGEWSGDAETHAPRRRSTDNEDDEIIRHSTSRNSRRQQRRHPRSTSHGRSNGVAPRRRELLDGDETDEGFLF